MFLGINISLVGRLKAGLSAYAVGAFEPDLVFDFANEYYRTDSLSTTFDSAITHTRNSNATMVDSDGLLKWAPHNLLLRSEEFDNAAWAVKSNIIVTANAAVAPNGATTAERLEATAANGNFFQNFAAIVGAEYTLSFFAKKADTGNVIRFDLRDGFSNWAYTFNLDTLATTALASVATDVGVSSVGDGWYRCYITATVAGTAGAAYVYVPTSGDSFFIWGAHLYRSDLGGMVNNPDRGDSYVPTTSAARYLPRRGHHVYNGAEWVNEGVLVESEARTNFITYSSPSVANWTTLNATVTENAATGFGGGLTASRLTGSGSLAAQRTGINATITGNACYWVRVRKDATHTFVQILQASDGTFLQNFDLSTGSLGTGGAGVANAGVLDEGDFWLLFMAVNVVTAAPFYIYLAPSASASYGQASDTSDYIDIDHVQLEAGLVPSSTIPTSGSTVTRAADTLTVPSANLPWPTPNVIGPELVTNGTFDTDTDWTLGTGWTISGGVASFSAGTGADLVQTGYSFATNTTYQITFDMTQVSGGGFRFVVDTTGSFVSQYFATTGSHTVFFVVGATSSRLRISALGGANFSIDNISVREIDPLAVSIQMEGRMTFADDDTTVEQVYWLKDSSNYIRARNNTSGAQSGYQQWLQNQSGVLDQVTTAVDYYTPGINAPFNIASRHGSTFINGAVDGAALTANTTPTALPDLSTTDLRLAYSGGPMILKKVRIFADDIGDSGIASASITTPFISGVPTISGDTADPEVGETLTASSAPVVIGTPSPTTTWQWKRGGAAIAGATSTSYTLTDDDVGYTITVTQTETNSGGSDSATSAATATVQAVGATIVTDRAGNGIFDRAGSYIEVRA